MWKDLLGIGLELIATFMSASGYTFQKLAHMDIDAGRTTKPYYKLPKFIIGLICLIGGSVIAVAVFGLLDQSKQAPMAACTLVYNSILSYKFLGEAFTRVDFISSAMMASGTVMAVFFSAKNSTKFTFSEILHRLNDKVVFGYSVLVFSALGCAVFYVEYMKRIPRNTWSRKQSKLACLACAFLGGFLAGFTAYFSKAVITVLYDADWEEFKNPVLYIYIAALATSAINQLRFLNRGLQNFDSLQIIPLYQSFIVFSGMMSGIVYYGDMREPELASPGRFVGFACGGLMTCSGIMLLILKKKSSKECRPAHDRHDPEAHQPLADGESPERSISLAKIDVNTDQEPLRGMRDASLDSQTGSSSPRDLAVFSSPGNHDLLTPTLRAVTGDGPVYRAAGDNRESLLPSTPRAADDEVKVV